MVGGFDQGHNEVEIYSPNGKCHHGLAPIPEGYNHPILAYVDNKILSCAGYYNMNCFQYHLLNNSWSVYSTAPNEYFGAEGISFNEKIFIADNEFADLFDPVENSWSEWTGPLNKSARGSCLLNWNNKFLLLGGRSNPRGIQVFDHSSQLWEVVESDSVPFDIDYSSCILLPNDEVLVVASIVSPFRSSVGLYNPNANTWKVLKDTTISRYGASLVKLGSRVFVVDGEGGNEVEEFDSTDNSWTKVKAQLISHRKGGQGVLALPADVFNLLPGSCLGVE